MIRVAVGFLALLSALIATAQAPPDPGQVADLIVAELKAARVPGAGVAVVSGDQMVARGYGVANAETGTPLQATTAVHLGSLTKLFTALAVVKALDAAKLPPETPIGPYVQGLGASASAATFDQLLSQTGGLRDRAGDSGTDGEAELGNSARELTGADFILPAGTVFSYTNLGYALAGAGLEGLRKQPYADVMRADIFNPLGMSRSTIRLKVATAADHAVGHRLENDSLKVVSPIANDTRIWPAGYMWSSANDMARALFALMHEGQVDGKQVLAAAVIDQVRAPHAAMPNVFVGGSYGYGLMMTRDRGVQIYEHGGTLPGFSSMLRFTLERRLGIAILTNMDNAPLRRIAQVVMTKALALPDQPPAARKETPVAPAEMKGLLGVYRNRGTADITVQAGRVVLILDEGPPMAVTRIAPHRYLARATPTAPALEFVLEPATDKTPTYLHFALWAYVKQ